MTRRFYFVRLIDKNGTRVPKYVQAVLGSGFAVLPYGQEPTALVSSDVSAGEHAALAAETDVVVVPVNVSSVIGGALGTVQTALEGLNIPASWMTAEMTYKTALRWIGRLFYLLQAFQGRNASRLFAAVTLSSLLGDLSAAQRQKLSAAATDLGYNVATLTLSMTIRAALLALLAQSDDGVSFAGESI